MPEGGPQTPAGVAAKSVDAFVVALIALAVVPIIVAVVRAVADGWIAIGDQALMEIRARDVLTAHHPLLGTSSSAALSREDIEPLNHPGPLMFDVLAVPVRLFGGSPGVAIGVGAVNVAATAVGIVFAARRAGRSGATLAALAFAGLAWAAGSESLYDPYNPTAAMLPCLACVFLAWSAIDLDPLAVPALVVVATFVVQLNNSYLLFLTPLVLAAGTTFAVRAARTGLPGSRAVGIVSLVAVVVLWAQPLLEQVQHGRDGNMARMVEASGVLASNPGPRLGTQIAAATLTLPPWWGRTGFSGIQLLSPVPGIAAAVASLTAAVLACVIGWRWAQSRGRAAAATALATAAAGISIAWIAAIRSPRSSFFGVSPDYVRWLWPASVFVWFAFGLTAWAVVGGRIGSTLDRRATAPVALALVGAVTAANLPVHIALPGQRSLALERPAAIELVDAVADEIDVDAVVYRAPAATYDVFGVPLLARLQRQGVEFLVDDPVLVRQFGGRRMYRGEDVAELRVVVGMDAIDARTDSNLIAIVSDLSDAEQAELARTVADVEVWLRAGRITLSAAGRETLKLAMAEPWLDELGDPAIDAATVSRSASLATAINGALIDADPEILTALDRLAALRRAVGTTTVAALLTPAPAAGDESPAGS